MSETQKKTYSVSELKGSPFIGQLLPCLNDPMNFIVGASRQSGDIISYKIMGQSVLQLNHPDLIRQVLIEKHKNYKKSVAYVRFESAGGLGLLTSHGEKWKRDRQKIQPIFSRELIATYHFEIANQVSEKCKQKWLNLTKNGSIELDIVEEIALVPTEIILKVVFGHQLDAGTVESLRHSYAVFIDYLKDIRVFPKVDSRKLFCMPSYFKFKKALDYVDSVIAQLIAEYRGNPSEDRRNMLGLLVSAQKNDPDHFSDKEIRDQCVTMIFAGFETTSLSLQWLWYALDGRPDICSKLRQNIESVAPHITAEDTSGLTFDTVFKMDYLAACFYEALRLYPPFWATSREPIADDYFGDFKVAKGTLILVPQLAMHRHPRYWDRPEEYIPERFMPVDEAKFDEGLYFPFNHGPRKCIGSLFSEMEIKTLMAKLLPLFDVVALNKDNNPLTAGISLKLTHPLRVRISRRQDRGEAVSPSARAYAHAQ